MELKNKIFFYILFYKSTLNISLATLVIVFILGGSGVPMPKLINHTLLLHPTLGFGLTLYYKEAMRKDDYPFYFNATCSKLELFMFSFIFLL